jgi:hypothetical protein
VHVTQREGDMGAICLPTGEPTEGVQAQIFESKEGVGVKNPTVPVGHKKPNQKQNERLVG